MEIDFFKTLETNKDKVELLLIDYPKLRDSDSKLIANFWYYEIGESFNDMTAPEFLKMFAEGKLTNTETIRRVRQKLQEEFPFLRGENYKERQKAGKDTQQKIINL